ncbi:hypothetical protein ACLFMI_03510 [Pseudonocardia nantongensis]|uniref:hypothetical protein n=1 Tax=Pseudonocardia nantongensis TaxID=1181885 RepID=UPI00397DB12E
MTTTPQQQQPQPQYQPPEGGYPYQQAPVEPPKKKRHVFRWVFLGIQALFLAWIIGGMSATGPACAPNLSAEACQAAQGIGTGIGVALIVALWIAVDFILGITYLIFRKK